jgi:uncharacterized protein involved in exopolysaccharide biosynthesis
MATILFDKMRAVRKLETEGQFTRQQAETLSEVMHDSMAESVATKSDLNEVETSLKADIAAVESALKANIAAVETSLKSDLKSEIAAVRTEIANAKVQTIVWVSGVMVTLLVASGILQHLIN